MANNLIQIKRSTATAAPTTLNFGELAYSQLSGVLYVGNNTSNPIPIGGNRTPGTLTANQAMVVNATSGIDKVIVANLTPTQIYANGSVGTAGFVLASGAAGNVYWVSPGSFSTAAAGSNTQIEFNDSGSFGADANLTFDKVAVKLTVNGAVSVGSGTSNVQTNTTLFTIQTASGSANLSSTALNINITTVNGSAVAVGSNAVHNASAYYITGNTTTAPTTTLTGTGLTTGNSTITGAPQVIVANTTATTTVNAGTISVGANVVVDTAKASFGTGSTTNAPQVIVANTTATTTVNAGTIAVGANVVVDTAKASFGTGSTTNAPQVIVANTTGTTTVNANIITVGSNTVMNLTAHAVLGNTTTAPTSVLTGAALNIGNTSITGAPQIFVANSAGNVVVNATSVAVQNTTFTTVTTPASVTIANATYSFLVANTSRLAIGNAVAIVANGGVGAAAQVLTSNGTGVYWGDNSNGTVTSVASGNGITGGTITTTGTLYAVGANGISVTTSGINVLANNGIVANTTGVFAKAANGISVDASGINVMQSNGIVSNTSGLYLQTGSTLTLNTTGLHVNSALSITDLSLTGNLTVLGTLTTLDTTNLTVKDSLIELANGNLTTDLLDVGFYGQFGNSTVTQYTGLFRDATDGIYKLFTGLQTEPTGTVNIAGTGYALANLQLNALTITNPLLTTSGGVGVNTYAKGDLLYSNAVNPTALTKLTLGTDGYVLTANSTSGLPEWASLDGGTF